MKEKELVSRLAELLHVDIPEGVGKAFKEKRKRKWHLHMDTSSRQAFLSTPVVVSETFYILEPQSVCILIGK